MRNPLVKSWEPVTQRVTRLARSRDVTVYSRVAMGVNPEFYRLRHNVRPHERPHSDTLVQHISVTRRKGLLRGDGADLHQIGVSRFGSGISYSILWDILNGDIGIGQGFDTRGAHTINDKNVPGYSYNQNKVAHAIAAVGIPGDMPSGIALEKLSIFISAMVDGGALTTDFDYVPHSLFAAKDCPTDIVRVRMPEIRRAAIRNSATARKGK